MTSDYFSLNPITTRGMGSNLVTSMSKVYSLGFDYEIPFCSLAYVMP